MAKTAEAFAREAHNELWRWIQNQREAGYEDTNWTGGFDRIVAKAIRRALMPRRQPRKKAGGRGA